jgi:hypothetical protein
LHSQNLRELYAFEENMKEIEKLAIQVEEEKRKQEYEKRKQTEVEIMAYLDELIEKVIEIEENQTIKIAFF